MFTLLQNYMLKNHMLLYTCQYIFCNLYAYDSKKRTLYIKHLTPGLTPSNVDRTLIFSEYNTMYNIPLLGKIVDCS